MLNSMLDWVSEVFNNEAHSPNFKIVERDTEKFILVHKFMLLENDYFKTFFKSKVGSEKDSIEVDDIGIITPLMRWFYHKNITILNTEIEELISYGYKMKDVIRCCLEYMHKPAIEQAIRIVYQEDDEVLYPVYWEVFKLVPSLSKKDFCDKFGSLSNISVEEYSEEWSDWSFAKHLPVLHQSHILKYANPECASKVFESWKKESSEFRHLGFKKQIDMTVDYPEMWETIFTGGCYFSLSETIRKYLPFLLKKKNSKGKPIFSFSDLNALCFDYAFVKSYNPFTVSIEIPLTIECLFRQNGAYSGFYFTPTSPEPIRKGSKILCQTSCDERRIFIVENIMMQVDGVSHVVDKTLPDSYTSYQMLLNEPFNIDYADGQWFHLIDLPKFQ